MGRCSLLRKWAALSEGPLKSQVVFLKLCWYLIQLLLSFFRWTKEFMNGMVSPWLVRRNRRTLSCWITRGFFKSRSQTLKGLPLKPPPSQRSARGSVWNWAAWWWVVCESYLVPRHKFSSDFTSPYGLPPCFTLRWPSGGYYVKYSRLLHSEDIPALLPLTCTSVWMLLLKMCACWCLVV